MKQEKSMLAEVPEQKRLPPSRQQEAAVNILRTASYLRRFCSCAFDQHDITSQQYNVLRILRGAGADGLPTLDIVERMIEQTPGITRLLDRLEAKKLVRRERTAGDRRQVFCHVTKAGLDLLKEVDFPVRKMANEAMKNLTDVEVEDLIRLLKHVRGER